MGSQIVKIASIGHATHDVLRIVTSKPSGFKFVPGQATEISINKGEWVKELRPFTFTSLPVYDYLEFTIKTYPDHKGVTNQLLSLKQEDELILHGVFGSITYKGEGVFIAGGAGITPFISIIRSLEAENRIGNNKILFANKTKADIILEKEFSALLGNAFINILSEEDIEGYHHGMITEDFLKETVNNNSQYFYLCGPPPMIKAVEKQLINIGVDENLIVKEEF